MRRQADMAVAMVQLQQEAAKKKATQADRGAINEMLLKQVQAQNEAREAQEKKEKLATEKGAERTQISNALRVYSTFYTGFNLTYQSYLSELNTSNTSGLAKLILVDPPYESNFVCPVNQGTLCKWFDKALRPGGTAVIFCGWNQIPGWQNVFHKMDKRDDWVVHKLFTVHRHKKFSFRSPVTGHKSMTEFAIIVHRKDPHSDDEDAKTGKKKPDVEQVEELLGPAPSGSWTHDFMLDVCPPAKQWYTLCVVRVIITLFAHRRLRWRQDSEDGKKRKKGEAVRPCAEKGSELLASFILK